MKMKIKLGFYKNVTKFSIQRSVFPFKVAILAHYIFHSSDIAPISTYIPFPLPAY